MSTSPPVVGADGADSTIHDARQRRVILIAVCIALMAVIASVTGLNVAQPELAVEFDTSQSTALWFITLYTISLAALLLPLGALGDRIGRKPVLLVGLAVFGVANVAAGLSTSSEMMLASRFASGVGAAMIMPITLAVITFTFPEEERAKGIGVWTGVAGGGGILAMYVSALLVDDIDACYRALRTHPWARKRRFRFSRPEEWNYGPAFGTHQVIELRDFEGIRFQLIEQPAYPFAQLHPFGYDPPGRKGK